MIRSSASASLSTSSVRFERTSASRSGATPLTANDAPIRSVPQSYSFMFTRSTTPRKDSSRPRGSWMGKGWAWSRDRI